MTGREAYDDRWCDAWAVALPASPALESDLADEIEAHVDAGGSILS